MLEVSQRYEIFKEPFPILERYNLFRRICSQVAIYIDFLKNEFVIVKGCLNGKSRAENELKILRLCQKCPYIIRLIGDVSINNGDTLFLIFPYFKNGDLKTFCSNHPHLVAAQIKSIAMHLFEAAKFLEKKSIIHRDIKLENILVTSDAFYFGVKLIDFEWAVFHNRSSPRSELCGTFGYMAPEVVDLQPYSFGVDIWSVTVVLYHLFTRCFPFGLRDDRRQYLHNTRHFTYDVYHEALRPNQKFISFLKKVFVSHNSGRLTAEQCLESQWLRLDTSEALDRLI